MKAGDLALGADALIVAALSCLCACCHRPDDALACPCGFRPQVLRLSADRVLCNVLLVALHFKLAIYKPHYTGIYAQTVHPDESEPDIRQNRINRGRRYTDAQVDRGAALSATLSLAS